MKFLFVIKDTFAIERIGLMTLSSILKKAGHETDVVMTEKEDIYKRMDEYNPDFLCYTITTGEHQYFLDLNRELKKKYKFLSLFGGIHATFVPETIEEEGVDCICRGEGDDAILEYVNAIRDGKPYDNIKNLWVKRPDGSIAKNEMRDLISDLDRIPFPDREILTKRDPTLRNIKTRVFFMGRGCPYKCTYCFNTGYNKLSEGKGNIVRMRSVDNVIKEIKEVYEKEKIECAHFYDDTFTLAGKPWLREFAKRMKEEIGIPFVCNVRPNTIDEEMVQILKSGGCYTAWMGVETADDEVRNGLLKRELSKEDMLNACRLFRKYKIKTVPQIMLGLPTKDTFKKDLETLRFCIKLKPTFVCSSIFYPYPSTELYDYSIKNGYFDPNNFTLESNKISSPLNFDEKTKKKIVNLHKLFGVTVAFPFLYPLTKVLIKLPFYKLYSLIFFGWYGFMYHIILRPNKMSVGQFKDLFKAFLSLFGSLKDLNKTDNRSIKPDKKSKVASN
ncbi:hypothetical protein CMO94_00190 [Candidatus Woesearchaeota archaeon]|jgi:radical SAM superfamily enzyme YgiQ (UPF0313 family)|nr:hypothetical protein [Candidatus Woesearchaeota archaeon]